MNKLIFYSSGISFSILLIILSCTHNPFFHEKINPAKRSQISGKVIVDGGNLENVFIWLEGLDLTTRTDEQGNFKLTIPPAYSNSGLNGIYNIFYYLGNYKLASSSVYIYETEFAYGQGDLDRNGNLFDIYLFKMLNIETQIAPSEIGQNYSGNIEITVTLKNLIDSVLIGTFHIDENFFTSIIFKNTANPSDRSKLYSESKDFATIIIDSVKEWHMIIPWTPGFLESGVYDVFPYLHIFQEELSPQLLINIGKNADKFDYDYLKIPFKQNVGRFSVKNPDGG